MYFNFQNMAALCDNNAEKSKFRFSRSPCGDARYLVIPCSSIKGFLINLKRQPWRALWTLQNDAPIAKFAAVLAEPLQDSISQL